MSTGKNPLMLVVAMTVPGAAHALGLGDIHVNSALNERLSADIDIVGATPLDLNGLRASVASRELFTRHGYERASFLSSLTFKVAQDAQGHPVLSVTSTEAFNEPLVNMLIDVRWGSGELTREYTLLLDPAEMRTPGVPAQTLRAPVSDAARTGDALRPVNAAAEPGEAPSAGSFHAAPRTASEAAVRPSAVSDEAELGAHPGRTMTRIKVGPRATLRGIAWRIGERNEPDLQRMMIALFRANPSAFEGNINLLHLGATLTIPSDEEIESISHADARREVQAQMAAWRAAAPGRAARLAAHGGAHAASSATQPDADGGHAAPTAPASTATVPASESRVSPGTAMQAPAADAGASSGANDESNEALTRRIQSLEQELREMKSTLDQEREQMAAMEAYAARIEQARAAGTASAAAALGAAESGAAGEVSASPSAPNTAVAPATVASHGASTDASAQAVAATVAAGPVPIRAGTAGSASGHGASGPHAAAASAPSSESHAGWMLGGLGALAAALAGIYLKMRRRPDSPDDDGLREDPLSSRTPAIGAASALRPSPPPRSSYEVVETVPLKALTDPSLDATTKLDQLGLGGLSDPQRVQAILEGKADEATQRLTSVTAPGGAAGGNEPTVRLQSPSSGVGDEATVRMPGAAVTRDPGMSLRADPSELTLADEVDLTATHHVHMPSELTENASFKERRSNPVDVLQKALEREPDRDDLRMKLLELYYSNAAQNQQAFLQALEKFADQRGTMAKEQWEKIASMGREIAAENPLFTATGAATTGAAPKPAAAAAPAQSAAPPAASSDSKIAYFRR